MKILPKYRRFCYTCETLSADDKNQTCGFKQWRNSSWIKDNKLVIWSETKIKTKQKRFGTGKKIATKILILSSAWLKCMKWKLLKKNTNKTTGDKNRVFLLVFLLDIFKQWQDNQEAKRLQSMQQKRERMAKAGNKAKSIWKRKRHYDLESAKTKSTDKLAEKWEQKSNDEINETDKARTRLKGGW